jgi:nucleotide-binding universal stress UspA family protein
MVRSVAAGLDGSPESRAAAEWAAREAELRGLPLKVVHVWEPVPEPMAEAPLLGGETHQHWSERIPRETAQGLERRHPGVEVTAEQRTGPAAEALTASAEGAELLVLGSRGLGGLTGFLVGSVGRSVIAHTRTPVVVVRAGEEAADEHEGDAAGRSSARTPFKPVVVGFDTRGTDDTVLAFAFDEAARRGTSVRVVHGWDLPPYYAYGLAADPEFDRDVAREQAALLADALRPWRQKYPAVDITEDSGTGGASTRLIEASREASLVVVGRRVRHSPFGIHIGSVTHAVLHHAKAPVAVVAHD